LQSTISRELANLREISEQAAGATTGGGDGWSRKQELGHLIDSATNNRIRFVTAAIDNRYSGPSYDGDRWVELGGYEDMPWARLVELWKMLNEALVDVLDRIPSERLSAPCRIGEGDTVTLEFVIDDYIRHMQHHLDHIVSRGNPGQ
jgi:hypothetical protein